MNGNPISWFEIYVNDMQRAKSFYGAVFACEFERLNSGDVEMWAFPNDMERPGAGGALVRIDGMKPGGNSIMVYFSCADCAVEAGRVEDAGGKLLREKFSIGEYGFIALAHDSEGNMIGLHSQQ
ncbi:MAG: VOC family protein [Xanthomonadales bacterium]|nr:VOC family protein [Xanthomonadales bacterium]